MCLREVYPFHRTEKYSVHKIPRIHTQFYQEFSDPCMSEFSYVHAVQYFVSSVAPLPISLCKLLFGGLSSTKLASKEFSAYFFLITWEYLFFPHP